MAQHHFVVFYDTDDQTWRIEYEDDRSGSVWNVDTQEWCRCWDNDNLLGENELARLALEDMFIKNEC